MKLKPNTIPFIGCILILVILFYYNNPNKITMKTEGRTSPLTPSTSIHTDKQTGDIVDHGHNASEQTIIKQDTLLLSTNSSQRVTPGVHSDKLTSTIAVHPTTSIVHGSNSVSTSATSLHVDSTPITQVDHKVYRYVLCSSYWEQQMSAIFNMFSLQRWGNSVGLTVVEPFVHMSELTFSHNLLYGDVAISDTLKLRDYIDVEYYNAQSRKLGVLPLETWKRFTQFSTKKIIVVLISYNIGTGGIFVGKEIDTHPPCLIQKTMFFDNHTKLFNELEFEVFRVVCVSFSSYIIPPETFAAPLKIDSQKESVTVWLNEWRGVENGRISFTGLEYNIFGRLHVPGGDSSLLSMIHPSKRLILDSKQYLNQTIGRDFGQYKAVVFRTKRLHITEKEADIIYYNGCADQLDQYLKYLPSSYNYMHNTFLAIDMGRFGSNLLFDWYDFDDNGRYSGKGKKLFQKILNIVYGNKSIEAYENDFIRATNGITDSGYVGAVQRTIAIKAKSLVVIGGHSSYQKGIVLSMQYRHSESIKYICYE